MDNSKTIQTEIFLMYRKAYFIQFHLVQWRPTEGPLNVTFSGVRYVRVFSAMSFNVTTIIGCITCEYNI